MIYGNNNGELRFEGEYLNGERNGKGKEYYYNGSISFEGEYLNDKKWNGKGYDMMTDITYELKNGNGFVEEYDEYNYQLIFEGEYLNGEKNGKIKEYKDGQLIFEGEYLNGEKNGKAKEYKDDKLIFEGEYLNGLRNGKGIQYYDNGYIRFEGEYLYGDKKKGKEYYTVILIVLPPTLSCPPFFVRSTP